MFHPSYTLKLVINILSEISGVVVVPVTTRVLSNKYYSTKSGECQAPYSLWKT